MCCRHVVCAWLLSCHLLLQAQAQPYIDFDDVDVGGGLSDIDVDYGKNATRAASQRQIWGSLHSCTCMDPRDCRLYVVMQIVNLVIPMATTTHDVTLADDKREHF